MFNIPEKSLNPIGHFKEETNVNAIFPGGLEMYEIKNQCQQIFGPESEACEQNLVSKKKKWILENQMNKTYKLSKKNQRTTNAKFYGARLMIEINMIILLYNALQQTQNGQMVRRVGGLNQR